MLWKSYTLIFFTLLASANILKSCFGELRILPPADPWYYKDITRQQAEAILLEESREGCFLVRDSVSKKNTFTLSVTSKDPEE
ncbi:unnamed protein product [Dibothriocephalus latus]|uniref:SH2 domain-containing protein n=1 Tax=Dibothriocephalus latus TaxID=60516 RepID=A0A3P7MFC4_DIBLA|nr:unnamed protein product [Dibothriocephalus latus]